MLRVAQGGSGAAERVAVSTKRPPDSPRASDDALECHQPAGLAHTSVGVARLMRMSVSGRLSNESYANWSREKGLPELNQILYWCWDPIDVNDAFPSTAGEYNDYALALLARLRKRAEASDVAAYLRTVERNEMELQPQRPDALRQVSERIVNWYEESLRWWLELRGP